MRSFVFSSVGAWGPFKMYITAAVVAFSCTCALVFFRLLYHLLFPLSLFFLLLVFGSWDRLLGRRATAAGGVGAAALRGPAPPLPWRPIERARGALQRAFPFPFALVLVLARRPPPQAVEVRVRVALVVGAALTLRVKRHTTHATRWSRQVRIISKTSTARIEESTYQHDELVAKDAVVQLVRERVRDVGVQLQQGTHTEGNVSAADTRRVE